MIEFHRHFERFAASLVRCLSEASYARKASGSATGQNAVNGIRFSDPIDIYIFIYTQYTTFSKLKFLKRSQFMYRKCNRTYRRKSIRNWC